jgi:hypothetical protein
MESVMYIIWENIEEHRVVYGHMNRLFIILSFDLLYTFITPLLALLSSRFAPRRYPTPEI